ncbi:MAG TPA: Gfo/Idh/MocA family oxidoreductase [Abditibacteriaceae bacterium]
MSELKTATTRRHFLKGAATILATPYIITSNALGQNGIPPASERLTTGHIGIGGMGGGHYGGALGDKRLQVLGACDARGDRLEEALAKARQTYGNDDTKGYQDYRELLARPDIDAVFIATPDHWHTLIACEAAAAGKDIYCEKPLTLTIREAQILRETVRRYGTVFQTGSQQRSEGRFRYACELVRNGRIGQLQTIHVGVGGPSDERWTPPQPIPANVNWEMWLGPAPWKPYAEDRINNWRAYRDYSGGQMTDWGAHHFDIAQWGMGMDGSGPNEIIPANREAKTPLTYKYVNGVTVYHGDANGVKFTGTEGVIEVNRGYLKSWPDSLIKQPIGTSEIRLYESNNHRDDWLRCIKTRRRPICDVAIGASSIIMCHLGNIATWVNRPLKWNPQTEEIIGDPEAARWLHRPYRAPWSL